jgi:putative ABC transport system ATP-binding protein
VGAVAGVDVDPCWRASKSVEFAHRLRLGATATWPEGRGGAYRQTDQFLRPTASVAEPELACQGLRKVYRMGEVDVRALDGVDMVLRAGELLVLLGASGSGKSTLLNILGGLDVPTSGRVFFELQELTDADEDALTRYRRRHVGFVFQFYNLIPSLTARENVALVTDIADDPLDAEDALALVGLRHRLDHFPAQLSGGEQQRVAIARAVAKRPSVLLCDEPTGALDFRTGVLVLDVIERVNRELGTATAVITHNAPIAEMADRVVTLSDGHVIDERLVPNRARPCDLRW